MMTTFSYFKSLILSRSNILPCEPHDKYIEQTYIYIWARISRDNRLAILFIYFHCWWSVISLYPSISLSIHHLTAANTTSESIHQFDRNSNEKRVRDKMMMLLLLFLLFLCKAMQKKKREIYAVGSRHIYKITKLIKDGESNSICLSLVSDYYDRRTYNSTCSVNGLFLLILSMKW